MYEDYPTKLVSIINLCLPQSVFSAIIQNSIKKKIRLFAEGAKAMLNSG